MPPEIPPGRTLKIYRLFAIPKQPFTALAVGTKCLLKDLQTLRNIIVHRAGTRGQDRKHQKEFDNLLRCHKNRISKIEDLWSGDSLWIPMETCKFFTLEME